jgi:hypothetical protein
VTSSLRRSFGVLVSLSRASCQQPNVASFDLHDAVFAPASSGAVVGRGLECLSQIELRSRVICRQVLLQEDSAFTGN